MTHTPPMTGFPTTSHNITQSCHRGRHLSPTTTNDPDPTGAEAQRLGLAADEQGSLASDLVGGYDFARDIDVAVGANDLPTALIVAGMPSFELHHHASTECPATATCPTSSASAS